MAKGEIDLKALKRALDAILEHLTDDLGVDTVAIDPAEDFYWECPAPEAYDASHQPAEWSVGRLSDDLGFAGLVERGGSADVAYNLVHIAPLLRYVGEKVKR